MIGRLNTLRIQGSQTYVEMLMASMQHLPNIYTVRIKSRRVFLKSTIHLIVNSTSSSTDQELRAVLMFTVRIQSRLTRERITSFVVPRILNTHSLHATYGLAI